MNKTNKKLLLTLILISSIFSLSYAQLADTDSECTDIRTNLRLRSSDSSLGGNEVTKLQKYLFANNFLNISSTGFFGSKTKQAVSDYQRSVNLIGTGFVGPLTRSEIKKDTCSGNVNGSVSDNGPVSTNMNTQVVATGTVANTVTTTNTSVNNVIPKPEVFLAVFGEKLSILSSESVTYQFSATNAINCNRYIYNISKNETQTLNSLGNSGNSTSIFGSIEIRGSDYPSGLRIGVTCGGRGGDTTVEKTITVSGLTSNTTTSSAPLIPLMISINGKAVSQAEYVTLPNNTATLVWNNRDATACTFNSESIPTSGSKVFANLTSSNHRYSCTNSENKPSILDFGIVVLAPAVVASAQAPTLGFTIDGVTVNSGQSYTLVNGTAALTWISIGASACTFNNQGITNAGSLTLTGLVSSSHTYSCANSEGRSSSLAFSIIVP